jgi:PAS domain S-box-containing protein
LSDSAFRVIVDTLSIPVLVVDGVGTILHAGGSVLRDFGYEPHELRGRNVIEFTPAEEVDRALQSIDELTRHDELGIGVPTAFPIIRKDGTWTWMVIGAVPVLDPPVEGMTFYFLPWDAQLHFDEFFASLLAGDPLDVVLARLALSVAISLEVVGVSIHHGFDGSGFQAISGAGHPAGLEAVRRPLAPGGTHRRRPRGGLAGSGPTSRRRACAAAGPSPCHPTRASTPSTAR